jgi:metal transporter CNNM
VLTVNREIVDESDVYVDVHKAIRRLTPAPRARRAHQSEATAAIAVSKKANDKSILVDIAEGQDGRTIQVGSYDAQSDTPISEQKPQTAIFMKRRSSAGVDGIRVEGPPVPIKASLNEMRQQLRLGPANRAAQPLKTRPNLFKIKQGLAVSPRPREVETGGMPPRSSSMMARVPTIKKDGESNETTPLLGNGSHDGTPAENSNGTSGRATPNGHESDK